MSKWSRELGIAGFIEFSKKGQTLVDSKRGEMKEGMAGLRYEENKKVI